MKNDAQMWREKRIWRIFTHSNPDGSIGQQEKADEAFGYKAGLFYLCGKETIE